MPAPYHGRCNCGAVTLTIDAEPVWTRQCWCKQCQRLAAGGPTNNALFPTADMMIAGELRWWSYVAPSGNTISQSSCVTCGTPVFGKNSARDGSYVVRLGMLDDASDLAPTAAIWLDEAPAWAVVDPALQRFDRQPPLSPKA